MNDCEIVDLYFKRDECAIAETDKKYGRYLSSVSYNILHDVADAEECKSDAYVRTWESIPPERPLIFKAFIAKIVRNISINRYLYKRREKRGGGECELVLDELLDVVPDSECDSSVDEGITVRDALNSFISSLPYRTRVIFVRRYWYVMPISEIAVKMELSESNVKAILMRTREKLRRHLRDKGVVV